MIDLFELQAREQLGLSDEWRAFRYERIGSDYSAIQIDLGIPHTIKSGPRKGQSSWQGCEVKTAVFSSAEHDEWCKRWETANGKCSRCGGTGRTIYSVSVVDGAKYRTCSACDGRGKP